MISQQEVAYSVGISRSTMCRIVKKNQWKATIDKRNNSAKCYPIKLISDYFKISQAQIKKRVREMRRDLGQDLERKLINEP